ncbi:MAG: hypothetical protein PHR14_09010 [Oscillospiraceae bacterium]|nr:hypothetical protein [Oscillospiraceae bacterium]
MSYTADLLYPEGKNKELMTKKNIPREFMLDLNIQFIANKIFPEYPDYVIEILSQLCDDPEVISYRQDILQDVLSIPELETVLHGIISKIYVFDQAVKGKNMNSANSFVDIGIQLESLKTYIECIDECFAFEKKDKVMSVGMKRLMQKVETLHESEDFKNLKVEVANLDYIFAHSIKSVTIALNFDEVNRPFEMAVLSIDNKPYRKKTLASKLFNLNNDPMQITPIGTFRKLDKVKGGTEFDVALFSDLNEKSNEVLHCFARALDNYYKTNISFFIEMHQQQNYYFGLKKAINYLQSKGIKFCRPTIEKAENRVFKVDGMIDMSFAYEILKTDYYARLDELIVPNDVRMDDSGRIFILTGPNNSGKTTYTRAVGVSQVLFQAGMFIPGTSAIISPVDSIFTHFPKEETIGINTSRLTQECRQLKSTFKNATKYSLILTNEAFSSTTYKESLYIAQGFIKLCRHIGCRCVFTTHMIDLAYTIDEMEKSTTGKSKILSMVSEMIKNDSKINTKITYKIKQNPPYESSYAQDILLKYGVDFDEMLN